MNRLRTSKIFRMLSETNSIMSTSDSQNQKSYVTVIKTFISNGKAEWRTYGAFSLRALTLTLVDDLKCIRSSRVR